MASCSACGSMIILGGCRDGQLRFCNARCRERGRLAAAASLIDEEQIRCEVQAVHGGGCPRCGGVGPVDVHTTHTVWSAIYLSSPRNTPMICCPRCGARARLRAIAFSGLFGWWGFPWGVILTPIQIGRNIVGLLRSPDPTRPSDALGPMVRLELAAGRRLTTSPSSSHHEFGAPDLPPPLPPPPLPQEPLDQPRSRRSRQTVVALAMLAVVLALGGYAMLAALTPAPVWLVNGLDQPYRVTIDGTVHHLPAYGTRRMTLREGSIEVVVNDPGIGAAAQTVVIETPFFTRPLRNRTFFLNPDRTAVLLWEQAVYSERPESAPDPEPYRVTEGTLLCSFTGIDYFFDPFPEEIELSSSASIERRERIDLLNAVESGPMLAHLVMVDHGMESSIELLKRRLTIDPTNSDDLYILSGRMEPDAFKLFAEPRLRERPLRIEWHRAYQEAMRWSAADDALVSEYRGELAADPGNGDLMYLLGRVLDDPDEAQGMLSKAAAARPPSAHAHAALAFGHVTNGRFEEAATSLQQGVKLAEHGELDSFLYLRDEIRHALGQYDALLLAAAAMSEHDLTDSAAVGAEVYYLARAGREEEARLRINAHVKALLREGYSTLEQREGRAQLELTLASALGDIGEFIRIARAHPELGYASDAALLEGDAAGAAAIIDELDFEHVDERFLVYCLASLRGQTELAQAELSKALALVREEGDRDWLRIADWIDSATSPSDKDIRGLKLLPSDKRIALLVLGCRFPETRARHFSLARTLNYDRHWPYLSIQMILDEAEADGMLLHSSNPPQ